MVDDNFEYDFDYPVHNLLKFGKVFDLENVALDQYEIIILSDTSGLSINDLDKFEGDIESRESNPAMYTRTPVPLQLTQTPDGYIVDVAGVAITIPVAEATVAGLLIIKSDTKDIFAADLYSQDNVEIIKDLTVTFTRPLLEFEKQPLVS